MSSPVREYPACNWRIIMVSNAGPPDLQCQATLGSKTSSNIIKRSQWKTSSKSLTFEEKKKSCFFFSLIKIIGCQLWSFLFIWNNNNETLNHSNDHMLSNCLAANSLQELCEFCDLKTCTDVKKLNYHTQKQSKVVVQYLFYFRIKVWFFHISRLIFLQSITWISSSIKRHKT